MRANQSNVSTKLKKHDFVIPEIEVTSQLIDLRSSSHNTKVLVCESPPFLRLVMANLHSHINTLSTLNMDKI